MESCGSPVVASRVMSPTEGSGGRAIPPVLFMGYISKYPPPFFLIKVSFCSLFVAISSFEWNMFGSELQNALINKPQNMSQFGPKMAQMVKKKVVWSKVFSGTVVGKNSTTLGNVRTFISAWCPLPLSRKDKPVFRASLCKDLYSVPSSRKYRVPARFCQPNAKNAGENAKKGRKCRDHSLGKKTNPVNQIGMDGKSYNKVRSYYTPVMSVCCLSQVRSRRRIRSRYSGNIYNLYKLPSQTQQQD